MNSIWHVLSAVTALAGDMVTPILPDTPDTIENMGSPKNDLFILDY